MHAALSNNVTIKGTNNAVVGATVGTSTNTDVNAMMSAYGFLAGNDAATIPTFLDEQPSEKRQSLSYSPFHTGANFLGNEKFSPEFKAQCEVLRALEVTTYFTKLATLVATIQRTLVENRKATGIVNPSRLSDVAPYCDNMMDLTDDMLSFSVSSIDFIDGLPTIDGVPVWDRLSGERVDFYNVFKVYRDMKFTLLHTGELLEGTRTLAGLSRMINVPGKVLSMLAKLYSWSERCAYYDDYMRAESARLAAQKMALLQSDHFNIMYTLTQKAMTFLQTNLNKLTPKDALQMLEMGVKYSRVSLGLSGDKPGNGVAANPVNQTTLSIYNADQMLNVNTGTGAGADAKTEVERQLQDGMKQEKNLLSILHVLQASGAMKTALHEDLVESGEAGFADIVADAEFEE